MIERSDLGDQQTIADSKRAFHQQFPYVIAPLYRRIADELLVELHLLSHQQQFRPTPLFAVGLRTVFSAFTSGYRPEEHPELMFSALCSSNGFNADDLRHQSNATLEQAKSQDLDGLAQWLPEFRLSEGDHYSRLMAIGLLAVIEEVASKSQGADKEIDARTRATEMAEALNFTSTRVEKDISLFLSSRERMNQAVELMEETLASERRKRERRQEEVAQGSSS